MYGLCFLFCFLFVLLFFSLFSLQALCGVAAGCTKTSITSHFALRANMADISAKENAQETAVNVCGMVRVREEGEGEGSVCEAPRREDSCARAGLLFLLAFESVLFAERKACFLPGGGEVTNPL